MSQEVVTYEKLKKLADEIKQSYIREVDKTKEIKEISKILTQISSKESLEEYFQNDRKTLNYFQDKFLR